MSKKGKNPRLGKVGGQAVIEGVMMMSGEHVALAVRKEDGSINVKKSKFNSLRKKNKFLNFPIIRGIVSMVQTMKLSYTTLEDSVKLQGIDDTEPETKFEKWLDDKLGDKFFTILMSVASVIGVVLAVGLFVLLPVFLTNKISDASGTSLGWWRNLINGGIRMGIFLLYIFAISFMKDIHRTFEYHGAEHKSVACYEKGLELTPENAKTCTRFHPRCGTSFMFVMLFISILIFSVVSWDMNQFAMIGLRLLLIPIVVGIGYEILMYAGKHENVLTKILSAPGLWIQRITTKEPDLEELEVAITALKRAMPDEFPEDALKPDIVPSEKNQNESPDDNRPEETTETGDNDASVLKDQNVRDDDKEDSNDTAADKEKAE